MLAKQILDLLQSRRPEALCDGCVAALLSVTPTRVRTITEAFGVTNDFTRVPANCPGCGAQGWTTRAGGTE